MFITPSFKRRKHTTALISLPRSICEHTSVELKMIEISRHINANHKQACSDLEKASLFITEALQNEIQRNTTLCMLIHHLEESAAENGRSLSEQVESNRQLKLWVDELQKQLEEKDDSLTQAKQSIAALKNELRDLKQQLQSHQSNHGTIQEVTEWQQDESLTNIVKGEDGVQQNYLVAVKEEDADDACPCSQSDEMDTSTEQTNSSSAGIRMELVQEEDEKLDMTPIVSSDPEPVKFLRLSVQLVDCCVTQGQQRTTSRNNEDGENPYNEGIAGKGSEMASSAVPKFTEVDNGRTCKSPVCGKDLSRKSTMEKHQQDVHTKEKNHLEQDQHTHTGKTLIHTGERPFHCGECGKTFTQAGHLKIHQLIHTGEKPNRCGECGKTFTQAGNLKIHQLIHTGEKPYQCTVCGKCFKHAVSLRNHNLIHTGQRPYQCGPYGKSFSQTGALTLHQLIHTGERPYQCGQCGKTFTQSGNLKKHQLIHTGEKPYQCTECGKCFRELGHLRTHWRLHTGERPFQCDQCEKSFTHAVSLKNHKLTHTGD